MTTPKWDDVAPRELYWAIKRVDADGREQWWVKEKDSDREFFGDRWTERVLFCSREDAWCKVWAMRRTDLDYRWTQWGRGDGATHRLAVVSIVLTQRRVRGRRA